MYPEFTFLLSNYPGRFKMMPLSIRLRNREIVVHYDLQNSCRGCSQAGKMHQDPFVSCAGGHFHSAESWGLFLFPEEMLGNHQDTSAGCYPCDILAELTLGIVFSLLLLLFQCSENFPGFFFVLFTSGTFLYLFSVAQIFLEFTTFLKLSWSRADCSD